MFRNEVIFAIMFRNDVIFAIMPRSNVMFVIMLGMILCCHYALE